MPTQQAACGRGRAAAQCALQDGRQIARGTFTVREHSLLRHTALPAYGSSRLWSLLQPALAYAGASWASLRTASNACCAAARDGATLLQCAGSASSSWKTSAAMAHLQKGKGVKQARVRWRRRGTAASPVGDSGAAAAAARQRKAGHAAARPLPGCASSPSAALSEIGVCAARRVCAAAEPIPGGRLSGIAEARAGKCLRARISRRGAGECRHLRCRCAAAPTAGRLSPFLQHLPSQRTAVAAVLHCQSEESMHACAVMRREPRGLLILPCAPWHGGAAGRRNHCCRGAGAYSAVQHRACRHDEGRMMGQRSGVRGKGIGAGLRSGSSC